MKPRFEKLSAAQTDALGQIATGTPSAHFARNTLASLESRGYLVKLSGELPGWPPVTIRYYEVPIDVHIRYCEWCAAHPSCLICEEPLTGMDTEYCEKCVTQLDASHQDGSSGS